MTVILVYEYIRKICINMYQHFYKSTEKKISNKEWYYKHKEPWPSWDVRLDAIAVPASEKSKLEVAAANSNEWYHNYHMSVNTK